MQRPSLNLPAILYAMHNSLTIYANMLLILFWASALTIMLAMNWPHPLAPVAVSCILGAATGVLQTQANRSASPRFREAKSIQEVRQPLVVWIPTCAAFALARELVSLPAVARLAKGQV